MANRPKGKLFALLAIFVAIGLVTATGAFTTVSATRTAEVNVAGDSAALLQLQPESGANGQAYAQLDSNNQLEINLAGDFDSDGVSGSGVNPNSLTQISAVFNITNQGTQQVHVYIEKNGTNAGTVEFYNDSNTPYSNPMTSAANDQTLGVGNTMVVSISIDTRGTGLTNNAELLNDITIYANTTDPSP